MRPSRLAGMSGIGVDRMGDRADAMRGRDFLRLENLDTDIPPHELAVAATRAAITEDSNNSYLPFIGQLRLRQAAAAHVARLSSVAYESSNVLIAAGGLSGLLNVLLTIIDTGDEVILTDPTYAGLINRVKLAGGVPKLAPFVKGDGGWVLDRDALKRAVTAKTRAFLLMSPAMPSGGYLTREDWLAVAAIAQERDLWVINDAAMERILFDGRPVIHPAGLPGMAERVISVGSASKEFRLIGWRVGWIVAPASLVPDLALVSMGNVVVPVGIGQAAATVALEQGDGDVARATSILEQRRDLIMRELSGLPVVRPAGGWSLLIDAGELGMSGAELSDRLFDKAEIAATPMAGWGQVNGAQFLRLVFANEPVERLRGIGARIRRAIGG
ncbi:MAG TPA: pyridoxal phosphate-dependent aminotransferase [Candidatus Polarisedimenticolia bacterium]|nr:pyridoxal phosphate-dependent aminotransferase [Candidatus Polarisedimenticolia bacterium]